MSEVGDNKKNYGNKNDLALLRCKECGKLVSPTARFCPNCGGKLSFGELKVDVEGSDVNEVQRVASVFLGKLSEMRNNFLGGRISILFLASDPTDTSRLRLGEEFREIDEQLTLAKLRDLFDLSLPQLAVRPKDITRALLSVQPQIVHFSGHGTPEGALCFEDETRHALTVEPEALADLFEQFKNQVQCVLLIACYTEPQAKALSEHINYVIGMNDEIGDEASIAFSLGFYQALGAGKIIEEAYKLGCVQIRLQGIPEHLKPVLLIKRRDATIEHAKSQVRHGIFVDLSHNQEDWDGFSQFAQNAEFGFNIIRKSLLECTQDINRASALIIALPRRSLFTPEESDYLVNWVYKGGGLFLLSFYAPIHHETEPNIFANRFGFHLQNDLIMPEGKLENGYCRLQPRSFRADLAIKISPLEMATHPILTGITDIAFLSSCSIRINSDPYGYTQTILRSPAQSGIMTPIGPIDSTGFMPLIENWEFSRCDSVAVLAATQYGKGRVVVSGSIKICTLNYGDNTKLVKNILDWISEPTLEISE